MTRHLRLALAWSFLIAFLCLTPGRNLPHWEWADLLSVDKLVHMLMFGILSYLVLTNDISEILAVLKGVEMPLFALALAIFLVALLLFWTGLRLLRSMRIAFAGAFTPALLLLLVILTVATGLLFAYYENNHSIVDYLRYYWTAYLS